LSQIEQTIEIDAPPAAVWAVLADFGAISQWVPLVGHSCLTTARGDGVGATRRVQIARQTLLEKVTTWKPGRLLTYTVEGLPPMAGIPLTTWELTPSGDGTRVRLTTALDTGVNPIRALVARKVLERMSLAAGFMVAGLSQAATTALTGDGDAR